MGLVWDYYPRGGGELLTALALADHADHQGENVRPGIAGLAHKTRQSERTVQTHVGRMRREHWLLVVRYAGGGFGRATEYRINPAWVTNPAESAPLFPVDKSGQTVQTATSRVQSPTAKGADHDMKGCKAFAPQPSGTVSEPSTTTTADTATVSATTVIVPEYEFPPALQGAELKSARVLLERCPAECRQVVLDEVAGIAGRGALRRSPLGLLRKLVQCAIEGTFVPSRRTALEVRRGPNKPAVPQEPRRDANPGPRAGGDIAKQALATIRANLVRNRQP